MKKIKKLSIILACMFSLALIPANGMVDKVAAAENNGGQVKQLKAVPYHVESAFQYKDKTYVFGNEQGQFAANSLSVVQNGQRKEIKGGFSSDVRLRKVGQAGAKVYLFYDNIVSGQSKPMDIYSLDTDTNQLAVVRTDLLKEMTDKYKGKFNKDPGFRHVNPACDASNPGGFWFICHGKENCIANTNGYMSEEGSQWKIFNEEVAMDGNLYVLEQEDTNKYKIVKFTSDGNRTESRIAFNEPQLLNKIVIAGNKGDMYVEGMDPVGNEDGEEGRFIRLEKDEKNNQYVPTGDWTYASDITQDSKGNVWAITMKKNSYAISRMENGSLVNKYEVLEKPFSIDAKLDVYDEDNLVSYGLPGYAIASKESKPENPNGGNGNNNNNGNSGTSDKGSIVDASSSTGKGLPETGSAVDGSLLAGLGLLSAVAGAALVLGRKN